jgi:exosortase
VKTIDTRRINHIVFAALLISGAVVFHSPLILLSRLIFGNDSYSHILLIPFSSLFFIWARRKAIFSSVKTSPLPGAILCLTALTLYVLAYLLRDQLDSPAFRNQDVSNDYLSLCMAGAVCWLIGSFLLGYGAEAFRRARFALLFLFFAVPVPMFLLNGVIKALQVASAEAANLVFQILPVSYHRDGLLVFQFPNVAVEVAEQCSGVRSSLALFILSVITGKLFLKRGLNRAILAFSILPITVFKNALRITTITLLANYVDMKFLTNHWIHSSGGIPFFAAAMAMFIPIVWLLRKGELKDSAGGQRTGASDRCKCQSVS